MSGRWDSKRLTPQRLAELKKQLEGLKRLNRLKILFGLVPLLGFVVLVVRFDPFFLIISLGAASLVMIVLLHAYTARRCDEIFQELEDGEY